MNSLLKVLKNSQILFVNDGGENSTGIFIRFLCSLDCIPKEVKKEWHVPWFYLGEYKKEETVKRVLEIVVSSSSGPVDLYEEVKLFLESKEIKKGELTHA